MSKITPLVLTSGALAAVVCALSSCTDDTAVASSTPPEAGTGTGGSGGTETGGSPGSGGKPASGGASAGGAPADAGREAAAPACGNGKAETGETCDTAIAGGKPGACPNAASCSDGDPCTKDVIVGDGTCSAKCDSSAKVAPNAQTKDQCCPAGATASTDADCSAACGNGTLDTGEDCDPGITSGNGVCITKCGDGGDPCQKLVTADPCKPVCTTVTQTANGDSCCPAGASTANDDDCTPTAFRMTKLVMFDPHPSYDSGTSCTDLVDAFNLIISNNVTGDANGGADGGPDGQYDLNFVTVLRPERHTGTSNAEFYQADCTLPSVADASPSSSVCRPNAQRPAQYFTYSNHAAGTCLAPDPQYETATYTHAAQTDAGPNPCSVSSEATLSLALSGVNLVFDHARIAGQWDADPATGVVHGLFAGFLTEARAQQNSLPGGLGPLSGQPLSFLFPTPGALQASCPTVDDSELGPDGVTRGWWWYLNFEATRVGWAAP